MEYGQRARAIPFPSRDFVFWVALLANLLAGRGVAFAYDELKVTDLRCEFRRDPVGLDQPQPRLSWTLRSEARAERQTACQILVASSPANLSRDQGDLWNSGVMASDETLNIAYAGRALASRARAWWKVRVWDRHHHASAWSEPAHWEMGLLLPSDWQASWIADPVAPALPPAAQALNGYHSELTNRADAVKWVAVDLGASQEFDSVRLYPARPYDWEPNTPGFLFPRRWRLETAEHEDFSDARPLVDRTEKDEPNPGTNAPVYTFGPVRGRFVRFTATALSRRDGDNYGLALAELEVRHLDQNLARGARVLALDSIETGAWARNNLTDGARTARPPGVAKGALPATLVRRSFVLGQPVRRATAYATALGLYELRLNGERVSRQLLAPEWTSYRKHLQYQTYDVTALLRPGANAVAAAIGEGWYAGRLMVVGRFAYGRTPSFLLQLEVELADGTRQTLATDGQWRSTQDGPITAAGIYDGENYDARREFPGWDRSGFDDSAWKPVSVVARDSRQLIWQRNEPIEVEQELKPIKLTEPRPGVYVFDFGQNMVGWCRVRGQGTPGESVTFRHAEMLNEDGTPYLANLRGAPQVDHYIPAADGAFDFEPHFTYHGFRYLELSGLAKPPAREDVVGRVFHSASPFVGRFECSDSSMNQLMHNIAWTARANLMSSPNDCPQRDERFGWMGDIQAFAQTAMFNQDLAAFVPKFAQDIRDDQANDGRFPDFAPHPGDPNAQFSGVPAWGDAGVMVPWCAYVNYADHRLLAEHFDAARRWVDYIHRLNPDLIWAKGRNNDYNDWLNGDWIKQTGWPAKGGAVPKEVFATAFFAHSTDLVARMAAALHRDEEALRYQLLFNQIKQAFNARFVDTETAITGDTQGGYALALQFDLLPEPRRAPAGRRLVQAIHQYHDHLSTGIQTTHRAMLELTRLGQDQLAWLLLTNRTFPSWRYMIDNGATTIWERWDGYVQGRGFQDPGMNSFNHWALGAVGEWMWRNIAGINPTEARPGWKHFTIAPSPGGGVTWAKSEFESIRGSIRSSWQVEAGRFSLEVTIPPGTCATVILPAAPGTRVTESGKNAAHARGISGLRSESGRATLQAESGHYRFVSQLPSSSTERQN